MNNIRLRKVNNQPSPRHGKGVTSLEKDLSGIKQVDQHAQALSSIPAIVDRYIDNKLGEVVLKPFILDFVTLVIKSFEAAVLTKSSSQPKTTYEAAASLSEYELTKILMDKIEENKSHLRADYKKEIYDALVKSYNTDKDIFDTYGVRGKEVVVGEGLDKEAFVEFMIEWCEEDEVDDRNEEDDLFN
nr:hypothetical protein [Tanacetum cinerariifolium]